MSGFKGGNGNMQNLMRQAQKMQEEMEKTAELLDDWEIVARRRAKRSWYT